MDKAGSTSRLSKPAKLIQFHLSTSDQETGRMMIFKRPRNASAHSRGFWPAALGTKS